MAPVGGSVYFPPLDHCLNGEFQLLSWKNTFLGISEPSDSVGKVTLKDHLNDSHAVNLLIHFLDPFSPATSQTKAAFDTRTSAIHITPNTNGRYNIDELKEDALWLSKEVKIDELSSLRVVVLEWQTRSAKWLLGNFADEDSTGIWKTVEPSLQSSLLGSKYGLAREGSGSVASFDSTHARRIRLLDLYLSERQYLAKTAEYISVRGLCNYSLSDFEPNGEGIPKGSDWVSKVGYNLLHKWNPNGVVSETGRNWLVDAVAALRLRVENLGKGSGWLQEEDVEVDVERVWCRAQVMELIHIMEVILCITTSSVKSTRVDFVRSWFKFVGDYAFFEQFELPFQDMAVVYKFPVQSLVSLISLAALKLPLALQIVPHIASASSVGVLSDESPYILNDSVFEQINDVLMTATSNYSCNAGPAILAWVIILQAIRGYADTSRLTRDLAQSQRAVESFSASQDTSTERNDTSSGQRHPSPHRRSSFGSDSSQQVTYLEDVLDIVKRVPVDEDPIELMGAIAVEKIQVYDVLTSLAVNFCGPFGSECNGKPGLKMQMLLLDLVRAALDEIPYRQEVIQAILAILQGSDDYWDLLRRPPISEDLDLKALFLNDDYLMMKIFEVSLGHFPYEMIPFLRLSRTLSTSRSRESGPPTRLVETLSKLETFTSTFSEATTYTTVEAEIMYFQLTNPLDMFIDQQFTSSPKNAMSSSTDLVLGGLFDQFQLPEGTIGREIGSSRPIVVLWRHNYSALQYLGRYLEKATTIISSQNGSGPQGTREAVSEIIRFFTSMLSSATYGMIHSWHVSDARDLARIILDRASEGVSRNDDVITLILAIFEAELHADHSASFEEDPNHLLVPCIQFVHSLLHVFPGRVWPYLGRSGLLGLNGTESRLAAVVSANEIKSGNFDFLLGGILLFDALIEEALAHVVLRKQSQRNSKRFEASENEPVGTGITDAMMENILIGFERIMMDVFQTCHSWKFISLLQRMEMNTRLCWIFDRILFLCFNIDDDPSISHKIGGFLARVTEHLLGVFLPNTATDLPFQPLLAILSDGSVDLGSTFTRKGSEYWTLQTEAALKLITNLIRINRYLNLSTSLEEQLFKTTPLLTKLYASHESYRLPVIELLEALVRSAGASPMQSPSMLGHMGQGTAKHFLNLLSILGRPLDNHRLSIGIWRLLSAVVSQRQQWLAIYILTGSTPRDSLKDKASISASTSHHVQPMLSIAVSKLTNLDGLDIEEAVSMLEFVTLAADFWPWVMSEILKDAKLTTTLLEYLGSLKSIMDQKGLKAADFEVNRVQIASLIVDLCAMSVRHHSQAGDNSFARKLLPHLSYLLENGVAVPSYNVSLHNNLRRNIAAKFPSCPLSKFKHTSLTRHLLGRTFYYDTGVAKKVLGFDPSWDGKGGQGFAEEFARANVNLSLVQAQVNLFQSWKTLVMQLNSTLTAEREFQKSVAMVVKGCLESNLEPAPPEAIFEALAQSRADLAFTLMQSITESVRTDSEAQSLLKPAWNLLRTQNPDLGLALSGPDAHYTRTLMKMLYLALQAHLPSLTRKNRAMIRADVSTSLDIIIIVQEIIAIVVAQGFRSLTTELLDKSSEILPADFALVIAIMRTALQIPGIEKQPEYLVTHFTHDGTARYACTLLSWADQLAIKTNEPLYGELSMTFLTELSTVPGLAESIATGDILAQISSANLMQLFRRQGGFGPFSEPRTIYAIWTRAVLPLALNLLGAVGAPVAAEVSAFINQFHGQLVRSSSIFDVKPSLTPSKQEPFYITLAMASDAHSMALLVSILDAYRNAGPSAGIIAVDIAQLAWDRDHVKEDLENWLSKRSALRESIVATTEKEEAWAREKAEDRDSGAENRLEEKIVDEMAAALAILADGET